MLWSGTHRDMYILLWHTIRPGDHSENLNLSPINSIPPPNHPPLICETCYPSKFLKKPIQKPVNPANCRQGVI